MLAALWVALTVTIGFLIPMLIFLPLLVLGWYVWRRLRAGAESRRAERLQEHQQRFGSAASPPPPKTSVGGEAEPHGVGGDADHGS